MNEGADVKPSSLPVSATFLVIFLIVTWVLSFVVSTSDLFVQLRFAVIIAWSIKILFDLVRWLKSDKDTRPKMRFPRKTMGVLIVVILAVGYFGYLILRDLGER